MNDKATKVDTEQAKRKIHENVKVDGDGCWIWTGTVTRNTGLVMLNGKRYTARKLAYMAYGLKPELKGRESLYVGCRKSGCVNPKCITKVSPKRSGRTQGYTGEGTYPWEEWFKPGKRVLLHGTDFKLELRAMQIAVRSAARRHSVQCRTKRAGNNLVLEVEECPSRSPT